MVAQLIKITLHFMACVLSLTHPVHNFAPYIFKIHFPSMLMISKVPVSFSVSDQKVPFVISSSVIFVIKYLSSI